MMAALEMQANIPKRMAALALQANSLFHLCQSEQRFRNIQTMAALALQANSQKTQPNRGGARGGGEGILQIGRIKQP